jgi:acid phosphatase (class A)
MKTKQVFFSFLFAFSLSVGLMAQEKYPDPFLSEEETPDPLLFLPDPPQFMSSEFYNDYYYYQYGKSLRDTDLGDVAKMYESEPLWAVFSGAIGVVISPENTPEIYNLASAAVSDAHKVNTIAKNHFARKRPFAQFNEPSLTPETDEEEKTTLSYPSGHTTRGWIFAFSLIAVAPEKTEAIMNVAKDYGMSRVICGHHYKSDIDASYMLASALFVNLAVNDAYKEQLLKAKREYERIMKDDVDGINSAEVTKRSMFKGKVFDVFGRTYDNLPSKEGIYIIDNQKVLVK